MIAVMGPRQHPAVPDERHREPGRRKDAQGQTNPANPCRASNHEIHTVPGAYSSSRLILSLMDLYISHEISTACGSLFF